MQSGLENPFVFTGFKTSYSVTDGRGYGLTTQLTLMSPSMKYRSHDFTLLGKAGSVWFPKQKQSK